MYGTRNFDDNGISSRDDGTRATALCPLFDDIPFKGAEEACCTTLAKRSSRIIMLLNPNEESASMGNSVLGFSFSPTRSGREAGQDWSWVKLPLEGVASKSLSSEVHEGGHG